jgi:hypothetical protein
MTGLCLIAQIFFAEETFFNRRLPIERRPARTPGVAGKVSRLIGVEQWHSRGERSTLYQALMRPIRVLLKPTVFISTFYYLLTFAWVVGINTTLSIFLTAPPYNFGTKSIGFFYFTPVVAAILGEIVGHWLHDALATLLTHRSKEKKLEPEYRLMAMTISTPFMITGLIVLGFALEEAWHYMIAALGWGVSFRSLLLVLASLTDSPISALRLRHHDHHSRHHVLQPRFLPRRLW